MLMYPDHLQNLLDNDHIWLIFLILTPFSLSEMGQIWVSWHFGGARWIFLIMVSLWLKLVIFGVSWHYLCGSKWQGGSRPGSGGIFPTLCVEFCLVYLWLNQWEKTLYYQHLSATVVTANALELPQSCSMPSISFFSQWLRPCPTIYIYKKTPDFFWSYNDFVFNT